MRKGLHNGHDVASQNEICQHYAVERWDDNTTLKMLVRLMQHASMEHIISIEDEGHIRQRLTDNVKNHSQAHKLWELN